MHKSNDNQTVLISAGKKITSVQMRVSLVPFRQ
jgi:hypothetical protein